MADRKYAAIQFTASDFAAIKAAQGRLNSQLGLKLSLAQTVIYCVEQLGKNDSADIYAQAQASQAAYEQAANYYKHRAENDDETGVGDHITLRSIYEEKQDFRAEDTNDDN